MGLKWEKLGQGLNITATVLNEKIQDTILRALAAHNHSVDQAEAFGVNDTVETGPMIWGDFVSMSDAGSRMAADNRSVRDHVMDTRIHNTGTTTTEIAPTTENVMGFSMLLAENWEWKGHYWEQSVSINGLYNDCEYVVYFQPVYPKNYVGFYKDLSANANYFTLQGVCPLNHSLLDFNIIATNVSSEGFVVRLYAVGKGTRYGVVQYPEELMMDTKWNVRKVLDARFESPDKIQAIDNRLYVMSKTDKKIVVFDNSDGSVIDVLAPPPSPAGTETTGWDEIMSFAVCRYADEKEGLRYACIANYYSDQEKDFFTYIHDGARSEFLRAGNDNRTGEKTQEHRWGYVNGLTASSSRESTQLWMGPWMDGGCRDQVALYNLAGDDRWFLNGFRTLPSAVVERGCEAPQIELTIDDVLRTDSRIGCLASWPAPSTEDVSAYYYGSTVTGYTRSNERRLVYEWYDHYSGTGGKQILIGITTYKTGTIDDMTPVPISIDIVGGFDGSTPEYIASGKITYQDVYDQIPTFRSFSSGGTSSKSVSGAIKGLRTCVFDTGRFTGESAITDTELSYQYINEAAYFEQLQSATVLAVDAATNSVAYEESDKYYLEPLGLFDWRSWASSVYLNMGSLASDFIAGSTSGEESASNNYTVEKILAYDGLYTGIGLEEYLKWKHLAAVDYKWRLRMELPHKPVAVSGFRLPGRWKWHDTNSGLDFSAQIALFYVWLKTTNNKSKLRVYMAARLYDGVQDNDYSQLNNIGNYRWARSEKVYYWNGMTYVDGGSETSVSPPIDVLVDISSAPSLDTTGSAADYFPTYKTDADGNALVYYRNDNIPATDLYSYLFGNVLTTHGTAGSPQNLIWLIDQAYGADVFDIEGDTLVATDRGSFYSRLPFNDVSGYRMVMDTYGAYYNNGNQHYVALTANATNYIDYEGVYPFKTALEPIITGKTVYDEGSGAGSYISDGVRGLDDYADEHNITDIHAGIAEYPYGAGTRHYVQLYLADKKNNVIHSFRSGNSLEENWYDRWTIGSGSADDITTHSLAYNLGNLNINWDNDAYLVDSGIFKGKLVVDGEQAVYRGDYPVVTSTAMTPQAGDSDAYNTWYNASDWYEQNFYLWMSDMARYARYNVFAPVLIENGDILNGLLNTENALAQMSFICYTRPVDREEKITPVRSFTFDPRQVDQHVVNVGTDYLDVKIKDDNEGDSTEPYQSHIIYTPKIIDNSYVLNNEDNGLSSMINTSFLVSDPATAQIDIYLDLSSPHTFTALPYSGAVSPTYFTVSDKYSLTSSADTSDTVNRFGMVTEDNNNPNIDYYTWEINGGLDNNINVENFALGALLPTGNTSPDGWNWVVFMPEASGSNTFRFYPKVYNYEMSESEKDGWFTIILGTGGTTTSRLMTTTELDSLGFSYTGTPKIFRLSLLLGENLQNMIGTYCEPHGLGPGSVFPFAPTIHCRNYKFEGVHRRNSLVHPYAGSLGYFENNGYDTMDSIIRTSGVNSYLEGADGEDARFDTVQLFDMPLSHGGLWLSILSAPLTVMPRYLSKYAVDRKFFYRFGDDYDNYSSLFQSVAGQDMPFYFPIKTYTGLVNLDMPGVSVEGLEDEYIRHRFSLGEDGIGCTLDYNKTGLKHLMINDLRYYQILRAIHLS